jgi:hypothetical protein
MAVRSMASEHLARTYRDDGLIVVALEVVTALAARFYGACCNGGLVRPPVQPYSDCRRDRRIGE